MQSSGISVNMIFEYYIHIHVYFISATENIIHINGFKKCLLLILQFSWTFVITLYWVKTANTKHAPVTTTYLQTLQFSQLSKLQCTHAIFSLGDRHGTSSSSSSSLSSPSSCCSEAMFRFELVNMSGTGKMLGRRLPVCV